MNSAYFACRCEKNLFVGRVADVPWVLSFSGYSVIVGGSCGFGMGYIEQLESECVYSPQSVALPCSSKHNYFKPSLSSVFTRLRRSSI